MWPCSGRQGKALLATKVSMKPVLGSDERVQMSRSCQDPEAHPRLVRSCAVRNWVLSCKDAHSTPKDEFP